MPELPEVQTIVNQLNHKIVGKKIKAVEIRLAKMVRGMKPQDFRKIVVNSKIENIKRRAKLLIINLSNGYSLIIHLKLSGQIIFIKNLFAKGQSVSGEKMEIGNFRKYAHIIYYFTDGSILFHNDMRQFGWVKIIKTIDLEKYFQQENFGPEPLDKNFTLEQFKRQLACRQGRKIKPLLMDQKFLAGIGNIYSQEACWYAKILPTRIVKTLKEKEIIDLYHYLIKILQEAIKYRGSSVDDYLDVDGEEGKYVPKLKVYSRQGKKCYRCFGIIEKMTLAGRGTYFCPKCQK